MTPATKYGNLSSSQHEDKDNSEVDEDSETQSNIDPRSPDPVSESSASQPVTRPSSSASSRTTKTNRKRLLDTKEDRFFELESKKLQLLSQTMVQDPPAAAPECDDLNFFKSLIPYMNTFQPIQKLKIRNKIQQVIIDEMSGTETWRPEPLQTHSASNLTPLQPLHPNNSIIQESATSAFPPGFSNYPYTYKHNQ